jgi:tRNA(Arg) A34 adenosine deaminase TadA
MCLAALYWSRCRTIYFGNSAEDAAAIGFDDSFIYDEMKVPMSIRKIPIFQLLPERAIVSFQQWEIQANKIEY